MRSTFALILVLFLASSLGACAQAPVRDPACPFLDAGNALLNSDRIERCFGSYHIDLLEPLTGLRVARLSSGEGRQRQGRTLAVTGFSDPVPAPLEFVMRSIRAGASIGSSLRDAGWTVGKETVALKTVEASAALVGLAGFRNVPEGRALALHVYRLTAQAHGSAVPVARIAELHHPDYLTLADLQALFEPAPPEPDDARFVRRIMELLRDAD